jgi:hypothetical protein
LRVSDITVSFEIPSMLASQQDGRNDE